MPSFSRRRFLQASFASLASASLAACSTTSGSASQPPAAASLQLLFYADTHAHWQPLVPHPPARHLGPMNLLGQAPYLTESSRLDALGVAEKATAAIWLTASGVRQEVRRTGQVPRLGGYAALAAALQAQRDRLGTEATLTLEGGQCWNGSGWAQVTSGRDGPLSSQWLGAEVRVASAERDLWPDDYAALDQRFQAPVLDAAAPVAYFNKGGVRIAVVGVQPPRTEASAWLDSIQAQVNQARQQAGLVLLLSDAGTNPNLWLAGRLQGVDLILSSRGQDLWPQLVYPRQQSTRPTPVCLAGNQGQGFFTIQVTPKAQGWHLDAEFHPVWTQQIAASTEVAAHIQRLRAPFARWLEQPLAVAPQWLYRRDALAGSWDSVIAAALKTTGADLTLASGVRYGLAVAPGETITREHLLSLTGGQAAPVFQVGATQEALRSRLETGASQWLGEALHWHTSEDQPRLTGCAYVLRYQAQTGQRVSQLQWPAAATGKELQVAGWSTHFQGEGPPLWQLLEAWLRKQPADWTLPVLEEPSLAFIEGHPGWHPEALLGPEDLLDRAPLS